MKNKREKYFFNKPFFVAGIASLFIIFLSLAANSLFMLSDSFIIRLFYSALTFVASSVALYGFYVLGKRYTSKFIQILALIGFFFLLIFLILNILPNSIFDSSVLNLNQTITNYNSTLLEISSNTNMTSEQITVLTSELNKSLVEALKPFLVLLVLGLFLLITYTILWGVALLKLNKKVKYAKVAGILNILGACFLIIVIGLFFLLAAFVFEVMILFDQAKKFKEY